MSYVKTKYFVREAVHNLWQFKARHAFALTIISLSFVILGVFFSLANNLGFRAEELARDLTVVFYLDKTRPATERDLVVDEIRRSPLVGAVRVIVPEDASRKFLEDFPELKTVVLNLDGNPFPPAVEVTFKDPHLSSPEIAAFIAEVKKNAAVEDAQFNRDWAERIRSLGRVAGAVGLFLGGILVLASFVIISNVIKLIVLARQSEIEILRFVGATNTFIRIPFLIEGALLGLAGSLLALGVVFLLIKLFPLAMGPSLGALREILGFRYLTWSQAAALAAGGGSVGLIGSLSSLSRFLRI